MVYTSPAYGNQIENMPGEPSIGGEELVGMSRDGLLKRLTYLTNTYVAHPGAMSLSPDGRYIAYWLTIEDSPYPGERLAVADLLTGNVTNYCIAGLPGSFIRRITSTRLVAGWEGPCRHLPG